MMTEIPRMNPVVTSTEEEGTFFHHRESIRPCTSSLESGFPSTVPSCTSLAHSERSFSGSSLTIPCWTTTTTPTTEVTERTSGVCSLSTPSFHSFGRRLEGGESAASYKYATTTISSSGASMGWPYLFLKRPREDVVDATEEWWRKCLELERKRRACEGEWGDHGLPTPTKDAVHPSAATSTSREAVLGKHWVPQSMDTHRVSHSVPSTSSPLTSALGVSRKESVPRAPPAKRGEREDQRPAEEEEEEEEERRMLSRTSSPSFLLHPSLPHRVEEEEEGEAAKGPSFSFSHRSAADGSTSRDPLLSCTSSCAPFSSTPAPLLSFPSSAVYGIRVEDVAVTTISSMGTCIPVFYPRARYDLYPVVMEVVSPHRPGGYASCSACRGKRYFHIQFSLQHFLSPPGLSTPSRGGGKTGHHLGSHTTTTGAKGEEEEGWEFTEVLTTIVTPCSPTNTFSSSSSSSSTTVLVFPMTPYPSPTSSSSSASNDPMWCAAASPLAPSSPGQSFTLQPQHRFYYTYSQATPCVAPSSTSSSFSFSTASGFSSVQSTPLPAPPTSATSVWKDNIFARQSVMEALLQACVEEEEEAEWRSGRRRPWTPNATTTEEMGAPSRDGLTHAITRHAVLNSMQEWKEGGKGGGRGGGGGISSPTCGDQWDTSTESHEDHDGCSCSCASCQSEGAIRADVERTTTSTHDSLNAASSCTSLWHPSNSVFSSCDPGIPSCTSYGKEQQFSTASEREALPRKRLCIRAIPPLDPAVAIPTGYTLLYRGKNLSSTEGQTRLLADLLFSCWVEERTPVGPRPTSTSSCSGQTSSSTHHAALPWPSPLSTAKEQEEEEEQQPTCGSEGWPYAMPRRLFFPNGAEDEDPEITRTKFPSHTPLEMPLAPTPRSPPPSSCPMLQICLFRIF